MAVHERIGAWLGPDGCLFRVWAPHATQVSVVLQDGTYWEVGGRSSVQTLNRMGDYWSALVADVHPGQLYRFRITTADGMVLERLDPAARDVLSSELTRMDPSSRNGSVVQAPDPFPWSPFVPPRFENFLMYQFHVGTFAGRGDQHNTMWSSFQQIESRLGYIREMGFNCIEPLPVHEYALDRSWGYNPASLFAPESSYGSPLMLKQFVNAAHQSELAVIFDVVYNHAGDDNVLWNYDGYSVNGGIYFEGG